MNLADLITAYRSRTRDTGTPKLWSDEEIIGYFNDAEREACERALLLLDFTTPEVCEIAVTAGTASYPLHESIITIERATLDLRRLPLTETSIQALDIEDRGWESRTGQPDRFFQSSDTTLTLVSKPVANDTLHLRVYRLPLIEMAEDTDEPEIAPKWHLRLLPWAMKRGYEKRDAETFSPVKAGEFEAEFERDFGAKVDANVKRKQRDRRPPIVRMGSW